MGDAAGGERRWEDVANAAAAAKKSSRTAAERRTYLP